jgi:ubiquinone biosynthesis protein COQ9
MVMSEDLDWAGRTEAAVLGAALRLSGRYGWSGRLVLAAGREAGLTGPETGLLLPDGARDLAALLARRIDAQALAALAGSDPAGLKIRERIRTAVLAWLRAAADAEPATRRWTGFLALPGNLALGLRLAWASADGLWRWAGDTANDENHYSKRGLLAEILISTLAIELAAGHAAAERHLDRRIAAVMAFERWKAGAPRPGHYAARAASWLGRRRYGAADPGRATDALSADALEG